MSTDLDEMLVGTTRTGGRYLAEGELLVRVTPTRVVTRRSIAG